MTRERRTSVFSQAPILKNKNPNDGLTLGFLMTLKSAAPSIKYDYDPNVMNFSFLIMFLNNKNHSLMLKIMEIGPN